MFPLIFAVLAAGNYSTRWENVLLADIQHMKRNVPFYVAHANTTMAAREACRKAQEEQDRCFLTKEECNYSKLVNECWMLRDKKLSERLWVMWKMMGDITVIVVSAAHAILQIAWAALCLAWAD